MSQDFQEVLETMVSAIDTRCNDRELPPAIRVDLSDIKSDLSRALEKYRALQASLNDPSTDWDALWSQKQREQKEFEVARDAWIRTQIITQFLCAN